MGSSLRGKCPICKGSNESEFVVNDKVFHCFKCKNGGNAIDFIAEYNEIDYSMAVEKLANELNIDIESNEQYKKQVSITQGHEQFVTLAEKKIDQVIDYLILERGLSPETVKNFRLGYDNMSIVIPIRDMHNRIVAISRRKLEGKPKYINSKNNELFEKSSTLYNLDRAKRKITNSLYVCEGYFDSISGDEQGLPVCAYLGSELTKEQIKIIKSICINPETTIIICADNDDVGLKSIKNCRDNFKAIAPNLSVRVMIMPSEEYTFTDGNTRVCKDLNDLHIQGIRIDEVTTENIDLYCLKQILIKCNNQDTEYSSVNEFIKTVTNPMIKADIAKFLSDRWHQDIKVIRQWFDILDKQTDVNKFKTVSSSLKELVDSLKEGIFTLGFDKLDASLKGNRRGDCLFIGACPSVGKTLVACMIALHFVMRLKLNVIFFSLEMTASALSERLIASFLGISTDELQEKLLTSEIPLSLYDEIKEKLDKHIRIVDENNISIEEIEQIVIEANATQFGEPVSLIVIDYLQYLKNTDTVEGISASVKYMKGLAKRTNALLLLLSQLNRTGNTYEPPKVSQLKGSGTIEATGDNIILLYKKAENPSFTLEQQIEYNNIITALIGKGRRGYKIKEVDLFFDEDTSTIYEK